MIRAFVGLGLDGATAMRLEGAQAGLPTGRIVDAENFHVTLAFLGEHPAPVIEDVHYALDGIRSERLRLRIDGVGLFGGEQPTAYFARIAPDPGLTHLRAKVLQAARSCGLRLKSSRFMPHVTLARFGRGLAPDQLREMQDFVASQVRLASEPFEVGEVTLFRSRLGRMGASYEALANYPLK